MKLQLIIEAENRDDIDGLKAILTNVQASMNDVKAPVKIPAPSSDGVVYNPPFNQDDNGAGAPTIPQMAPPTAPLEAPVVDDKGVPWDINFHAGTKTKKTDGTWKAKKGCDKEALKAYEAQFTKPAEAPAADPITTQPLNEAPAADPIGLPGALPLEQSALEKLTARIHNIAKSETPCAHLDWTADSPTWKDMSTADAINALLKASGLSQGFIDLPNQNDEAVATIDLRISLAWPTL